MRIILLTIFLIAGVRLSAQLHPVEGRIVDCQSQEGIYLVSVDLGKPKELFPTNGNL